MYRAILVDDEEMIREGFKSFIHWEEYGIEIVAEASNGIAAIEEIRKTQPHILITDIKMPEMNGIELLKALQESNVDIHSIIISGYDDFDLVKEAVKYKVENYLLKPVDRQELISTIEQITKKIESDLKYQINIRESYMVLKNNVLNRLVTNKISNKEFREKAEFLGINLYASQLRAAVIELRNFTDVREDIQLFIFAACNICEESIGSHRGLFFTDQGGRIVIIFHDQDQNALPDSRELHELLSVTVANIEQYAKLQAVAGIGGKIDSYKQLHLSYSQALKALDYKLVGGSNKLFNYDEIIEEKRHSHQHQHIDYDLIENLTRAGKEDDVRAYINEIYQGLAGSGHISPKYIRYISAEIIMVFYKIMKELNDNILIILDHFQNVFSRIYYEDSVESLQQMIGELLAHSISYVNEAKENQYSKLITDIIQYVNEHYASEISLKTLSQQLYVSPAHLGRMFKLETGYYFSDFLINVRIQKATELLLMTNMKVNDIAVQVGVENTNYFYTLFKKYTGLTPVEMRNRALIPS